MKLTLFLHWRLEARQALSRHIQSCLTGVSAGIGFRYN